MILGRKNGTWLGEKKIGVVCRTGVLGKICPKRFG
jgi:hypothetical protein